MGQLICRREDPDWSAWIIRVRKSNFPRDVINGDVEKVKRAISERYCDVDVEIYHEGKIERPLSIAIKNIRSENDNFFQISQMLLNFKDVDINAKIYKHISYNHRLETVFKPLTIFQYMCIKEHITTLGVELLLNDYRTDPNDYSIYSPLYLALMQVETEGDYFYEVTKMILKHPGIDVNVSPPFEIWYLNHRKSVLGFKLLLDHPDIHVCHDNFAYHTTAQRRPELLKLILSHPGFDVNKKCERCNSKLPMELYHQRCDRRDWDCLEVLVEGGADLGIVPRILRHFMHPKHSKRFIRCTLTEKRLAFLLKNGANMYPSILAQAISFDSVGCCKILLENRADPNSAFEVQRDQFLPEQIDERYRSLVLSGKDTALHAAYRIGSKAKIELLLKYGANAGALWLGETPYDLQRKYCLKKKSKFILCPHHTGVSNVEAVKKCRSFLRSEETRMIFNSVCQAMTNICGRVSEIMQYKFKCILSGSVAENTKCFELDEFDFIFDCQQAVNDQQWISITQNVYSSIDSIIRFEFPSTLIKSQKLRILSFLFRDKISCIHMMWERNRFEKLDIFVDVIVCFKEEYFVKCSRHLIGDASYKLTEHTKKNKQIRSLPSHIRTGLILAKAVRLASIAKPSNLEEFDLEEIINVDDIITSFVLKAAMFERNEYNPEYNKLSTSFDVAVTVYENLRSGLNIGLIVTCNGKDRPIDCTKCDHEYGCCKQRKLMLAMVETILKWLKEHKDELQDIDYADDVDIVQD